MIIIAIDALEHSLVEKFDCKNLKQDFYGKTNISDFSQPRTMVLWSSFLTGENKEDEILAKGDKEMWNTEIETKDTFLKHFKKPRVIDLPGYSYEKEQHEKERILLKRFFEANGDEQEKVREEYNKDSFDHHRKIKNEFMNAISEGHDILIGYFSFIDVIGHLNFGNETMMKMLYKDMDEIVAEAKKRAGNEKVIILSDHGMKAIGRFGDHSNYGFWSTNFDMGFETPKITDFASVISGKQR